MNIIDEIKTTIAENAEGPVGEDLQFFGLDYVVGSYLDDPAGLEIMLNRNTCEIDARPARYADGCERNDYSPEYMHLTRWMLDNGYRLPETNTEMDEAVDLADIPCYVNELQTDLIGYASVNAIGVSMCEAWRENKENGK